MNTSYVWRIINLTRRTSDDMVWRVEYKVTALKGEFKSSTEKSIKIPPSSNPIPFSDLSEEQIIDWVKQKLGPEKEQKIYDFLDSDICKRENKTSVRELPWKTE